MDYGWLSTPEQYYRQSVDQILTNVFRALQLDPKRRFTHAEISFFEMWWSRQNTETKTQFRELVNEGRFEFVNGGWVAPDEACPLYDDLMENIRYG